MEAAVQRAPAAWEPVTPRGVAAFARARLGRVLLVQLMVGLISAGVVDWCVYRAWFPAIREAIRSLPKEGEIRAGRLDWRGETPVRLAEGRFLAVAVDLDREKLARSPAHVQVEFSRSEVNLISLLGYLPLRYPAGYRIAFNYAELEPWWGAWSPVLLAFVTAGVVVGLMTVWGLLAAIYAGPVWVIGFFANRDVTLGGCWRLAGAALMPGALFMCGAICLYGLGGLDVVRLGAAIAAHFVIGWVYLGLSPFWIPRIAEAQEVKANPFVVEG